MSERICNVPNCKRAHSAKGMCNLHYQRSIYGKPLEQPERVALTECVTEGCSAPPRSRFATLCPKHYHRQYRHGDVNKVAQTSAITVSHGRRYRTVHDPLHPLAMRNGAVYEHRKVLYAEIGPGEHTCHWCGRAIEWGAKGPGELVPDHLNGFGDDNRIENLVPSCQACNIARGAQARSEALRKAGWWSEHDTIAELTSPGRRDPIAA